MTGESRRRDVLLRGELGEGESGAPLHEPEERRLAGGDSELLCLLAELACEPEERGPEVHSYGLGAKRNVTNH